MDKETFTEKILQMEGSLYAVARTHFASSHDCADAVSETVLRAWKSRHTLRDEAYFTTWVTRIAINQCRTMRRRTSRVFPVEEIPETPQDIADPLLYDGVMALDLKYRLVFVLHHVEGYTAGEIARMLGAPRGTVLSRLHRARQKLQKFYGEEACQHV